MPSKMGKKESLEKRNAVLVQPFLGKEGQRRLIAALCNQELIERDTALARRLAQVVSVEGVQSGTKVITETETGQDAVVFVLSGRFKLFVKGHYRAEVIHGQAVGEYPVLFPGEKHRATVVATEDSAIGRISGADLEMIADEYPMIWKNIARFVSSRLIRSGQIYPSVNEKPGIFIGSSSESLDIACRIVQELSHDPFEVSLWTDEEVFRVSSTYIESLEEACSTNDFAILVFQGEDKVASRGKKTLAPRDNVIFEAGLFMGRLGRNRTMLMTPSGVDVKIPSDLLGLNNLRFASPKQLRPVANSIRKHVKHLGPLQRTHAI